MPTEVDILLVPKISDSTQLVGKSLTISDDTDGTPYRFSGDTINNAIQEIDDKIDRVDGYQLIATADVNRLADTSGENTGDQQASDFDIKDLTDSTDLRGTWSGKQDALGFTPENVANKSNDVSSDANSTTKYPSVKAIKDYADGLVVGLLDDRGSFDASDNVWPSTGGSGVAGTIKKGDIWYISVEGTLGGVLAKAGYSIRALTDNPGQTASNWDMLNVGLGYVPENVANKKTTITNSDVDYPTGKAVGDALEGNINLYNITLAVPLTAGQYYTSTTARATVPSGVRKRGLELVYETSAGVWYCERFIGASVTTWTTATDWEVVPNKLIIENTEEVTAESLVHLKNRIDALQKIIQDMILGSVQIDSLNIVKTLNLYGSSNMILTGSAAPAVIPDFIGQFFIKTSATTACYQATGNLAVGDWKQIG